MQEKTLCILLAGGIGSRLYPLTADRAKPAVPFGGRYRIIDFTLSNCVHSGLRRILVLTQYKSHSLQNHLRDGWSIFSSGLNEYIMPVPPQMRTGESWYVGTADAIYQNLYLLERSGAELVLILSGDHIYRMDYAAMLRFHKEKGADVTIAAMEVRREEAQAYGVLAVDEDERIVDFQEKPLKPTPMPNNPDSSFASMGIYVFSLSLLSDLLKMDHQNQVSGHDFGKDILPSLLRSHRMCAYRFGGAAGRVTQDRYWRDVGTIDAYYEANMDLLKPKPSIDLYQKDWPILTYEGQHPPARTVAGKSGKEAVIINCMLASGTVITGGSVTHSILFPNTRVEEGAVVEASLLFEGVTVGAGASLKKCIIDKRVQIPAGETIGLDPVKDAERFTVSERGVIVVPQGYRFGLGSTL
jgi:glucose-1-phosphate adenylyltransferase